MDDIKCKTIFPFLNVILKEYLVADVIPIIFTFYSEIIQNDKNNFVNKLAACVSSNETVRSMICSPPLTISGSNVCVCMSALSHSPTKCRRHARWPRTPSSVPKLARPMHRVRN